MRQLLAPQFFGVNDITKTIPADWVSGRGSTIADPLGSIPSSSGACILHTTEIASHTSRELCELQSSSGYGHGTSTPSKRRALGWAFAALAVTLLLTSCAPLASGGGYKIPTSVASPDRVGLLARLEGVLYAQVNNDGSACLWVTYGSSRMYLVWPQGYSASGSPLRILNEQGQMVATVGERVILRGGLGPIGPIDGCPRDGEPWIIAEVVQAT
jgi:hypothetical protein